VASSGSRRIRSLPRDRQSSIITTVREWVARLQDGDVAQLVEHLLCKQEVAGSSPAVSTKRLAGQCPVFPAPLTPESLSVPTCAPCTGGPCRSPVRGPFRPRILHA
jgi:hypothetical protein